MITLLAITDLQIAVSAAQSDEGLGFFIGLVLVIGGAAFFGDILFRSRG